MKYSVIIPVYKTEPYLRQCVDSVLAQTYRDFEVILVDDGSPDACPDICDELCRADGRVKVIHQKNAGLGFARNAGIEKAQGAYLLFLDSDDYWLKDSVLESIDRSISSCDLGVFDLRRFTEDDFDLPDLDCFRSFPDEYPTGEAFIRAVLEKHPKYYWYFWRYVFKASLFSDRELRFTDQKSHEDVALSYQVILKANEVRIIKDSFYAYRQNRRDSLTKTVTYASVHAILMNAQQEIRRVQAMPELSEAVRELLCRNLSNEFFDPLTLSSQLPGPGREKILEELEQCRWIAKYGRGKDRVKAILIRLIGVRTTARLLGLKRKVLKMRSK